MDAEVLRARLRETGEAVLRMQGSSMSPLLPNGSRAKLRPTQENERLQGAIVAIEVGQQVVVHQVVACGKSSIITQGIASPYQDAPTTRTDVVGVVCERMDLRLSEHALRKTSSVLMRAWSGLRRLRGRK